MTFRARVKNNGSIYCGQEVRARIRKLALILISVGFVFSEEFRRNCRIPLPLRGLRIRHLGSFRNFPVLRGRNSFA